MCVLTNNIFFSSVDALGCCGNSGLVQLLVKLVILCRHCTQIKLQDTMFVGLKNSSYIIFVWKCSNTGFYAVLFAHIPFTSTFPVLLFYLIPCPLILILYYFLSMYFTFSHLISLTVILFYPYPFVSSSCPILLPLIVLVWKNINLIKVLNQSYWLIIISLKTFAHRFLHKKMRIHMVSDDNFNNTEWFLCALNNYFLVWQHGGGRCWPL